MKLAVLVALVTFAAADARAACAGVWLCPDEITVLPASGPAWQAVRARAGASTAAPRLADQDDDTDIAVLAKALVHARTGEPRFRDEVAGAVAAAMGTEKGGRVLALARNLPGYVIAADIVGLPPPLDREFRIWLRGLLDRRLDGETLRTISDRRPNNWGTHAAASRLAVARYLGDDAEVRAVAERFRTWVGDAPVHRGFTFGKPAWQADPARPVGINPAGARRNGHSIDGVLADDQRRCCDGFVWPPPRENYVYEALQGALAQAVMLHRAGYDEVWAWGDRALLRAFVWLHDTADFPAQGDDTWQPHIINHYYGTHFPAPVPSRPGKSLGFTDWTHADSSAGH